MGRVMVVGSVNRDWSLRCSRLPRPGETALASRVTDGFGGKGGNQAVAAASLGADTWLLAVVGADDTGTSAVTDLFRHGVHADAVLTRSGAVSGMAMVVVDDAGENLIVVAPGANAALDEAHVAAALDEFSPDAADVVLVSAEVDEACVAAAARACAATGARLLYNVAPARPIRDDEAMATAVLIVNEVEAVQVTGTCDVNAAVQRLRTRSAPAIVTRGARGATLVAGGTVHTVPAEAVPVVDTTGAGDAFCGAVAADLAAGADLSTAVETAVAAAAISVQAAGARGALARREDIRR